MADDVTLAAAPADAGQPAAQAVESAPVQSAPDATVAPADSSATTAAPAQEAAPDPVKELDTLRKRYSDSSAEALRLYRENESLKAARPTAPPAATPPTYSPEQLETWKEQWLVKASTEPDKAAEAAHQIRLIDAELRKGEIASYGTKLSSQAAYQKLEAEVQPILNQYKDELMPGTPVHTMAQQIFKDAVIAGAADNAVTATSAVLLALAKSGKFQQGSTLKAAAQATQSLNQALKTAAVAGGGGANTGRSATPDLASMDIKTSEGRAAFEAYRKSIGVERY